MNKYCNLYISHFFKTAGLYDLGMNALETVSGVKGLDLDAPYDPNKKDVGWWEAARNWSMKPNRGQVYTSGKEWGKKYLNEDGKQTIGADLMRVPGAVFDTAMFPVHQVGDLVKNTAKTFFNDMPSTAKKMQDAAYETGGNAYEVATAYQQDGLKTRNEDVARKLNNLKDSTGRAIGGAASLVGQGAILGTTVAGAAGGAGTAGRTVLSKLAPSSASAIMHPSIMNRAVQASGFASHYVPSLIPGNPR